MAKKDIKEDTPVIMKLCTECNQEKEEKNFWLTNNICLDPDGGEPYKKIVCKDCVQKLYNYLYNYSESDEYEALFKLCNIYNWIYNEKLIGELLEQNKCNLPNDYLNVILHTDNVEYNNKCFLDQFDRNYIGKKSLETLLNEYLSDEDKRNLAEIKKVFLADPFESKPLERRAALYRSLSLMIDPSMSNDLVRQKAAITIVESFDQLEQIDKTISGLMTDTESITEHADEIQTLNKMRTDQQRMITNFCKDHGFSEKYANAKTKGTGTLSAIIRDMEESNYDEGKVNLYDIETSSSMMQCAEISAKSICKQLALSDYEYAQMVEEQTVIVRKEIAARKAAEEKLRLTLEKLRKQELLKELEADCVKKGLSIEEIKERLDAEFHR